LVMLSGRENYNLNVLKGLVHQWEAGFYLFYFSLQSRKPTPPPPPPPPPPQDTIFETVKKLSYETKSYPSPTSTTFSLQFQIPLGNQNHTEHHIR
jgi:hypothetical protein